MPGRIVHLTNEQLDLLIQSLNSYPVKDAVLFNKLTTVLASDLSTKKPKPVKPSKQLLFERADLMRQVPTDAERVFHSRLKLWAEQTGIEVVCQQPFMFWIFDFYLVGTATFVEIDGGVHDNPVQRKKDLNKQQNAKRKGFTVIRIRNEDVERFDMSRLIPKKTERGISRHQWLIKHINAKK